MADGQRIGVIVPCRDEARTIATRLDDLARDPWPTARTGAHVVVVVDDGSCDGTAALASAQHEALAQREVRLEVLERTGPPGKPAAIRTGLERLASLGFVEQSDLIVLTDADVTTEPGALRSLAGAFASEPQLGMACGTQRYMGEGDGRAYDRLFAWIRRAESRAGALLSVHGQLLAWRASLDLVPPDGRAADDLELVVAARDRSPAPRVRIVREAVFLERRATDAAQQVERRARAWFQHFGGAAPRRFALRAQWRAWAALPYLALVLTWPLVPFSRSISERRSRLARALEAERSEPLSPHWSVDREPTGLGGVQGPRA